MSRAATLVPRNNLGGNLFRRGLKAEPSGLGSIIGHGRFLLFLDPLLALEAHYIQGALALSVLSAFGDAKSTNMGGQTFLASEFSLTCCRAPPGGGSVRHPMFVLLSVVEDGTDGRTKGRIAQLAAVLNMFLDLGGLFGRRVV